MKQRLGATVTAMRGKSTRWASFFSSDGRTKTLLHDTSPSPAQHDATYQEHVNDALWEGADLVSAYTNRDLRPVEVMLLALYAEQLRGRVLEIGCGAGRVTGYLAELGAEVHATDVSERMLQAGRRRYPDVTFECRDLRDLDALATGAYDAVVASNAVLDVLGDEHRKAALAELHRLLTPGGMLIFSTHNRAAAASRETPTDAVRTDPIGLVRDLVRLPRWMRNHRLRVAHEVEQPDYAILNDLSHDFEAMHYYVSRAAQVDQLERIGFKFVECRDIDGHALPADADAPESTQLHFVARR